jgi:hypothetical protein
MTTRTGGSLPNADDPDAISGWVFPAHPKVLLSRGLYNTTSIDSIADGCVFDRDASRMNAVRDLPQQTRRLLFREFDG